MQLKPIWRLATKELQLYFASPIGYLFLAVYLGVTLFVFFWVEAFFARNIADVRPMFEWLPILLIFLAAALTMRIWSDERRTGTLEFLSTLPLSTWELVLGKFVASTSLLLVALLLTLVLPIAVSFVADLDWGPVLAGYAAALLLGMTYLAIGVFVSARTDNQIIALILTTVVCGLFYILGSPLLTNLVDNTTAELLRSLGAGSRFESITRGVLDIRDLFFYGSIAAIFLALNALSLHQLGWTKAKLTDTHRSVLLFFALVIANLLIANVWLHQVKFLRWDVTEGQQYSISEVTERQLSQLSEPLEIRGYFSGKTHPLLAPLAPKLADLLQEYAIVGGSNVRVEIIDPQLKPELEEEANSKYGIRPVPFQVADRYQSSLVNSYFDVLIMYGDQYETLSFQELVEVKAEGDTGIEVLLKNPEYALTRSIRSVMSSFQSGGNTFSYVANPVKFVGYISSPERLPEALLGVPQVLTNVLEEIEVEGADKFSYEFLDPDAGDGEVAAFINENFGFRPIALSLFDTRTYYFYLTLQDGETTISISLSDSLTEGSIKQILIEGLKRYATGLLNKVEMSTPLAPPQNPYQQQQQVLESTYHDLRAYLSTDFDIETNYLHGAVDPHTDALLVIEPDNLSREQVFRVDQYLMQGGTVVVASSPYKVSLSQQFLGANPRDSGLESWLAHHGVEIQETMVLDSRNTRFPLPVNRQVGGLTFQEIRMFDYPFFVDVRGDSFVADNAISAGVDQLALSWASPIAVNTEKNANLTATELVRSSDSSWTIASPDLMPQISDDTSSPYYPPDETKSELLAVLLEGRFDSFFEESPFLEPPPEPEEDEESPESTSEAESLVDDEHDHDHQHEELEDEPGFGEISTHIGKSPESARLIVIGSSEFLSDSTTRLMSTASGTIYSNPMQLVANIVDWTVEDSSLLSIRGRGNFNRTLPPLSEAQQLIMEWTIYGLAVVGLLLVFILFVALRKRRLSETLTWLGNPA